MTTKAHVNRITGVVAQGDRLIRIENSIHAGGITINVGD